MANTSQNFATLSRDVAPTGAEGRRTGEVAAIAMLSIGFGLVGLDRFIFGPMFPTIARDLSLDYQDLGMISGVLALTYGLASIFSGQLSDSIGRKRVFLPALIAFSLMVGLSGLAVGLFSLILLRAIMGVFEGAYMPAGITAAAEASRPSRIGFNIGITQMAVGLTGAGLAPLIATQLLKYVSWQWVFAIIALPGLVLAAVMQRRFHDAPRQVLREHQTTSKPLATVLRVPQVWAVALASACWFSCLIVIAAFLPTYLSDALRLDLDTMGIVLSGAGLGSVIGMLLIPFLSDRLGRKLVMVVTLAALVASVWLLTQASAEPVKLFALIALVYLFNAGAVGVGIGPLAGESVPPQFSSTSIGFVLGIGEIIGGALAPVVAGIIAQTYGIGSVLVVSLTAAAACFVVVLLLVREPKYKRMASVA